MCVPLSQLQEQGLPNPRESRTCIIVKTVSADVRRALPRLRVPYPQATVILAPGRDNGFPVRCEAT